MASNFLATIRNAQKLEAKTVNEYREILHRFFVWAIEQQGVRMPGDAKANPVAGIKRLKTSEPSIRFLQTMEHIREQLAALEDTQLPITSQVVLPRG